LIVHINPKGQELDISPFEHDSDMNTDIMKTEGLRQMLDIYKYDAVFAGARRDEEKTRAKAMTKTFMITEISFRVSFVLMSIWFVSQYGLVGMSYSFVVNYTVYLIMMVFVTRSAWAG
jgi:hypothetical protein